MGWLSDYYVKKKERGSFIVLTAASMVFILGATGLAIDGGNLYRHKAALQNNADAAAKAGGMDYAFNEDDDSAKEKAIEYVGLNMAITNADIQEAYPKIKKVNDDSKKIIVALEEEVPTYFMRVLGKKSVNITAKSTVLCSKVGGNDDNTGKTIFDFAIIGGDNNYTQNSKNGNAITFDNNVVVDGDVHANGGIFLDSDYQAEIHGHLTTQGIENDEIWATAYGLNDQSWSWSHFTDTFKNTPLHMDLGEEGLSYDTWYNRYVALPAAIDNGYVPANRKYDDELAKPTPTRYGSPDPGHYVHYCRVKSIDEDGNGVADEDGNMDLVPDTDHYVDISLSESNPLTSALYKYIQQTAAKEQSQRENDTNHAVFYDSAMFDEEGNYVGGNNNKSYAFNPSSGATYPRLTCGSITPAQGEAWKIWEYGYNVIIVDGDLTLNIPEGQSPSDTDYLVAMSLHGNISIQNGSAFHGILYAPEGRILIDGRQDLPMMGSFVGKTIYITSSNKNVQGKLTSTDFDFNKENKNSGSTSNYGNTGNYVGVGYTVEFIENEDDD